MITCPYCDQDVIPGSDECESCGQPLNESHLPLPASEIELALLTDRVALFQGKKPIYVSPTMPVREALRLLVDNKVGCVVVVQDEKLAGIFTERDVLLKLGDRAAALADRPVSEFMTASVQTLPPTAKIAFAVHRMALGGYRHVPIEDAQGKPSGIFSVRDILYYLARKMNAAH
jgi:CBS domain-containing protein